MPASHESGRPRGPSPKALVALECARALGSFVLVPPRALIYAVRRGKLRRELEGYLQRPASVESPANAQLEGLPERPLRVFVSAAEPSGETHALRFVDALKDVCGELGAPAPEFLGLGSPKLAERGVRILADPVARAAMGSDVVRSLGFYLGLVEDSARAFREEQVDLFVPVDSPALHAPLGRIARRYGVPTVHYVTPQLWGWAPWRASSYRKAVDRTLSILPFEPAWFEARSIPVGHVGHPQVDALAEEQRAGKIAAPTTPPGLLVLLPGSRVSVVQRNLPWMLSAAARTRLAMPELEVAISSAGDRVRPHIEAICKEAGAGWAELHEGELHELLGRARVALSVSGTVLIDLLVRRIPSVVIYRLKGALGTFLAPRALTVPWFSSVNLLAGREVFPEYAFHGEGPLEEVSARLVSCYKDERERARALEGLEAAAGALGPDGAAKRAARHALEVWKTASQTP